MTRAMRSARSPAAGFGGTKSLKLTSPSFADGEAIPRKHTADGDNVSPELSIEGIPDEAEGLALVVDDPDAPAGTWIHWLWWDLPPDVAVIEEGADLTSLGGVEGTTSWQDQGWRGPSPPAGTHRYFFRAYALREPLELEEGATLVELQDALEGKVIAWGELMGTYHRG